MDVCRATREGWLDNDSSAHDFNKTFFDKCKEILPSAGSFFLPPENMLDKAIRNMAFPYLTDYEGWVRMDVEVPMFEFDKEKRPVWRNLTISRRSGIKVLQKLGEFVSARDYEFGDIPEIGSGFDRDKDPYENHLRMFCLGDMHRQYFQRSHDFYEYLKNVSTQNELFILWSTMSAIGISVFAYLVFMVYVLCNVQKMRDFYVKLFQIEVSHFSLTFFPYIFFLTFSP
jgi:hypothetical protein